ncbi:hypothetical protein [Micromonospora musae]|uniref:hypothetical protein n=1 Tax=Micromonospora musae TaxID=1894970 RepID=UPI001315A5B8|nr:hypothetical protein [Micromonospora musae]
MRIRSDAGIRTPEARAGLLARRGRADEAVAAYDEAIALTHVGRRGHLVGR